MGIFFVRVHVQTHHVVSVQEIPGGCQQRSFSHAFYHQILKLLFSSSIFVETGSEEDGGRPRTQE